MVNSFEAYKKLVRSTRMMNKTILMLTIRFNLDLKQRTEVEELIKDLAETQFFDIINATKRVRHLMENRHKDVVEIREMYNIPKIRLKEFQPDDAS